MRKYLFSIFMVLITNSIIAQPTGTIMAFAGKSIPKGWDLCDGKEVSKTDSKYINLHKAIGNTWGGNNNPNFNLPDLREQFLMGVKSTSDLAQSGGTTTHNHSGSTSHAFGNPDGYHADPENRTRAPQVTGLAHTHTISTESNLPPFKKILYIIKL